MSHLTDGAQHNADSPTLILLAVFNGGLFLKEQLESIANQTDSRWNIIASDDGSDDATVCLLTDFKNSMAPTHDIAILDGPRLGAVQNFFHLIKHIPEGTDCAALCDQDDYWLADKIARGRAALDAVGDTPTLYCAASFICDETLKVTATSRRFHRPPSFRNALVQSIAGGNTMMLNRAAIELIKAAVQEAGDVIVHDWWIYQIITACGGNVIHDNKPVLYYRQHGQNLIGANVAFLAKINRIALISQRRFSDWNERNIKSLQASRHRFTQDARDTLDLYAALREGPVVKRLLALRRSGVHRQSVKGTVALYFACLLNRI